METFSDNLGVFLSVENDGEELIVKTTGYTISFVDLMTSMLVPQL